MPSNLLYEGLLYLTNDGGVITCLDARTGEVVYEGGRLPIRGRYSASMVGGGGRILMVNTDGDAAIMKAGRTHEVLGNFSVGEPVWATPAIVGDRLYVRAREHLFALGPAEGGHGSSPLAGGGRALNPARIAVLLPCLNEQATIADVVAAFQRTLPDAAIYVCDNGSDDDTARVAAAAGATVIAEPRRGKGRAIRRLFHEVDADIYLMADGDDTYDTEQRRPSRFDPPEA